MSLYTKPVKIILSLLFLLALTGQTVAQDVVITSEQSTAEMVVLGMLEFQSQSDETRSLPVPPERVIGYDLSFSGRFKIFDAISADSAALGYFRRNGALAYLRGKYNLDGDQFSLECELIDLESGDLILGKSFKSKKSQYRDVAHKFSDDMVYQLFGEKGIAQTRIVYVTKRAGNKQIYAMDYDGANVRPVTNNKSINVLPNWLEGKDKVLYTSYLSGYPNFYVADIETDKNSLYLKSPGMNSSVHYNPIDREIVYATSVEGNTEIYRRSMDENAKSIRLTFSPSIETSPTWSPNGYEIVFVSDRSGRPMIYVMDRDGSNLRRLTYEGSYNTSPAWSPKGDRIAFCGINDRGLMDIMTIGPDGADPIQLTGNSGSNENPSWSPDGRHLVFTSTRKGQAELWVMDANGTNQRRISFSGGNSMPRWSGY